MPGWPTTRESLAEVQRRLAVEEPDPWRPPAHPAVGAVFIAFSTRRDPAGVERSWAAAAVGTASVVVGAEVVAPYEAGYLALREGPLLERAVRELCAHPGVALEVLVVNASGRDHPRGAGLALHLGAVLDVPTVGVTDRPLVAVTDEEGRLVLDGCEVGRAVLTRRGARPVFAHAAWRTDAETALEVVRAASVRARTPEPLRRARFLARAQRARDEGRLPPGWSMDRLAEPRFPGDRA